MESLKNICLRQQQDKPEYFDDPHKDQLIRLALSLAEEICVLRDQLETSLLLAKQGLDCTAEAIEAFEPDEVLTEQRLAKHTHYFEEVMQQLLPPETGHATTPGRTED